MGVATEVGVGIEVDVGVSTEVGVADGVGVGVGVGVRGTSVVVELVQATKNRALNTETIGKRNLLFMHKV